MRAKRRIRMPLEVSLLWNHAFKGGIGQPLVKCIMNVMETAYEEFESDASVAPIERNAEWREYLFDRISLCVKNWQTNLDLTQARSADIAFRKRLLAWSAVTGAHLLLPENTMLDMFEKFVSKVTDTLFVHNILKSCVAEVGPVTVYQSNYGIDLYYRTLTGFLSEHQEVAQAVEMAWVDCGAINFANEMLKPYCQQVGVTSSLKGNMRQ